MVFEYTLHLTPIPPTPYTQTTEFFALAAIFILLFIIFVARNSYNKGRYEELNNRHNEYIERTNDTIKILELECYFWRTNLNVKAFNNSVEHGVPLDNR